MLGGQVLAAQLDRFAIEIDHRGTADRAMDQHFAKNSTSSASAQRLKLTQ